MTYEPPLPGNPNQFVLSQHVLPQRSIERFVASGGCVEVQRIANPRTFPARPNNSIFCVRRVWNQRAEKDWGRKIEDRFQALADELLQSGSIVINDQSPINDFFALINVRLWAKSALLKDVAVQGIAGVAGETLSAEEFEALECNGALVLRSDGTLSSRDLAGIKLAHLHDRYLEALDQHPAPWQVVRSVHGEFVVPDTYGVRAIVPLSPTAVLVKGATVTVVSWNALAEFNRACIAGAIEYYFARDLQACPR